MRSILILSPILFLVIFMSCSNNTKDRKYKIDPVLGFSTGPGVKEKIPEFSLPDQHGNIKSLNEIIGKNGAILNFYRSASWWPYCKKELVEFQDKIAEFQEKGISIISISYDSVQVLKEFAEKYQITYPLLSDVNSDVIRMFGIFNTSIDSKHRWFGIPYPGIYIVDNNLTVVKKQFEKTYYERPTAETVLIKHLNKKVETFIQRFKNSYMTGSFAISDTTAYPAQILTISIHSSMKNNFHLYGSRS